AAAVEDKLGIAAKQSGRVDSIGQLGADAGLCPMIDSLRRVAVDPGGFHRGTSPCRPAGASPTTRAWGLPWIRPIPCWKLRASPERETEPAVDHQQTTLVPEWSTGGAGLRR